MTRQGSPITLSVENWLIFLKVIWKPNNFSDIQIDPGLGYSYSHCSRKQKKTEPQTWDKYCKELTSEQIHRSSINTKKLTFEPIHRSSRRLCSFASWDTCHNPWRHCKVSPQYFVVPLKRFKSIFNWHPNPSHLNLSILGFWIPAARILELSELQTYE